MSRGEGRVVLILGSVPQSRLIGQDSYYDYNPKR